MELNTKFGEEWFQPKGLILLPQFIAEQYNTSLTIERMSKVKLKLEFLNNIDETLRDETFRDSFKGYLLFDVDLKHLRPGEELHVDAALFSDHLFQIYELVDNDDEDSLKQAYTKLERVVGSLKEYINDKVPIKGAVVLPNKSRLSTSIMSVDNSLFYKDELEQSLRTDSQDSTLSSMVNPDFKIALAKMLDIGFFRQGHPETKEEAIYQASQRCYMQRLDEQIARFSQIDFNQIKLTDTQSSIKDDLLSGNALVWGGYCIGKSVSIISALSESLKRHQCLVRHDRTRKTGFKILFLSAQSLLSSKKLTLSPFLLIMEKWMKEAHTNIQVINYTHFLHLDIYHALKTKTLNEDVALFCSYLLKATDLDILMDNLSLLNNFNIIVLEETHALDLCKIKDLIKYFEKGTELQESSERKLWITSNAETLDSVLKDLIKISPKKDVQVENLRNIPAVAKLGEAINNAFGPERYPSTDLPMSSIKCHINVTYEYEWNDEERINKIVSLGNKWKPLIEALSSSILFIDCEDSNLLEKLQTEGTGAKIYGENYRIGEPLFLRYSDPIEAIVAGAEWHVLILHIKIHTMNSIQMIQMFNKRIISRSTTKIYIFSDKDLDMGSLVDADIKGDEDVHTGIEVSNNVEQESSDRIEIICSNELGNHHSDDINPEGEDTYNVNIRNSVSTEIMSSVDFLQGLDGHLMQYLQKIHEKKQNGKVSHFEGYDVTQLKHLPLEIASGSGILNIYLIQGQGKAFIVNLNLCPQAKDEVIEAQSLLKHVWKILLPCYSGHILVSGCKQKHVRKSITRISQLFYLLQLKALSEDNRSGYLSISAEETDQFAENGKIKLLPILLIQAIDPSHEAAIYDPK